MTTLGVWCCWVQGALLHEVTPLKAATGVGPQTMWSDYFVAVSCPRARSLSMVGPCLTCSMCSSAPLAQSCIHSCVWNHRTSCWLPGTTHMRIHVRLCRHQPSHGACVVSVVAAVQWEMTRGCVGRADSAFGPLKDDLTSSPLYSILKDANVDQLFVCGLASDYSVQYTVLDAKMVLPETKVFVVEDACRGVTAAGIQDAFRKFSMERVAVCDSKTEPISKFPVYQPPLKKCVASPRCCSLRAMAPGGVHTRVCVRCCHDVHTGFAPHQVHECSRSQRHCQTLPVRRRARRLGRVSRHDDWWHHEISVVSQAPGRVLQQPPPP